MPFDGNHSGWDGLGSAARTIDAVAGTEHRQVGPRGEVARMRSGSALAMRESYALGYCPWSPLCGGPDSDAEEDEPFDDDEDDDEDDDFFPDDDEDEDDADDDEDEFEFDDDFD